MAAAAGDGVGAAHHQLTGRLRAAVLGPQRGGTTRRRASDAFRLGLAVVVVAVSIPVMKANSAAELSIVRAVHPPPAAISWLVTAVFWLGSAGVSVLLVVVGLLVPRLTAVRRAAAAALLTWGVCILIGVLLGPVAGRPLGGDTPMTTATEAISTPLLIAGAERPGAAGVFPVYDPARLGVVIGHAASVSADDAHDAVAAAHDAWPAWAALTAAQRTAIVLKALDGLGADADLRADILSRENGKIRFEAAIDLAVFTGRFHRPPSSRPSWTLTSASPGRRSTPPSPSCPPASSRSSIRSTGHWRSSRRPCRTR